MLATISTHQVDICTSHPTSEMMTNEDTRMYHVTNVYFADQKLNFANVRKEKK